MVNIVLTLTHSLHVYRLCVPNLEGWTLSSFPDCLIAVLHLTLSCASSSFSISRLMSANTQSLHLFLWRLRDILPSTSIYLSAFGHIVQVSILTQPTSTQNDFKVLDTEYTVMTDILTRSVIFLLHIHLTIALSAVTNLALSATAMGQVSLAWSITRRTHAPKMPPLWSGDIAELVRIGRSSLKLFQAYLIFTFITS